MVRDLLGEMRAGLRSLGTELGRQTAPIARASTEGPRVTRIERHGHPTKGALPGPMSLCPEVRAVWPKMERAPAVGGGSFS